MPIHISQPIGPSTTKIITSEMNFLEQSAKNVSHPTKRVVDSKITDNERQHFHGTPDQILLDVEEYVEHGITFCSLGFEGTTWPVYHENMERFAREVMPKAKDIGPGAPY